MKLDQIPPVKEVLSVVKSQKIDIQKIGNSILDNKNTILELLNPLMSVNSSSYFQSVSNLKQLKVELEKLIAIQSNIVFYILHQNFMCDDAHKEFFKNMVGRFYDLPEWSWGFFQGKKFCYNTVIGLVLTENKHLYEKFRSKDNPFHKFEFLTLDGRQSGVKFFNRLVLEEYFGIESDPLYGCFFVPSNIKDPVDFSTYSTYRIEKYSFGHNYEFGRMYSDKFFIRRKSNDMLDNYWFIATYDWIKTSEIVEKNFRNAIQNYGVYASLGIENIFNIIMAFKERAEKLEIDWQPEWIPNFNENEKKLIRSLSQTFQWSKEYIFDNEELLNLDVLGLNMTVPWDMDLVKFFIRKGYGGRMSENKAVFDKVFKPALSDDVLEMLFKTGYEKY